MRIVYPRCCGLDVHKRSISACLLIPDKEGGTQQEIRRFGTVTRDLLELCDWLASNEVTHVAMESTGVYWKPVWNILEANFTILLVNAQHVKAVPGRKTDAKDCQWIADLLQHGLLKGSFIPPSPIRELRDLTRTRASLRQDHTSVANRMQKILEDANVKLASVATDWLGVSGRAIVSRMLDGEQNAEKLADLCRGRLRDKIPEMQLALEGRMSEHHRWVLRLQREQLEFLEAQIAKLDAKIQEKTKAYQEAVDLCTTIPGIEAGAAANLIAEMGVNMDQFPSAAHLASWAGLCPGNNESAGKRLSGKARNGNVWLRRNLCQAAWAASQSKNTYLSSQFRRLAARKGKKRAIVAVGHTILIIVFHMLKNHQPYRDLGADYFDRRNAEQLKRALIRRLERLGLQVTVQSPACPPSTIQTAWGIFSRESPYQDIRAEEVHRITWLPGASARKGGSSRDIAG
jgi:transposase